MKQLGNLALLCARRPDILLRLLQGIVTVYAGAGPSRSALSAAWDNDGAIQDIIHELNFGRYAISAHKETA